MDECKKKEGHKMATMKANFFVDDQSVTQEQLVKLARSRKHEVCKKVRVQGLQLGDLAFLKEFRSVEWVQAGANKLVGFPFESLRHLRQSLTLLELANNNLKEIGPCIAEFVCLRHLHVGNNELEWISPKIAQLHNTLQQLDLLGNETLPPNMALRALNKSSTRKLLILLEKRFSRPWEAVLALQCAVVRAFPFVPRELRVLLGKTLWQTRCQSCWNERVQKTKKKLKTGGG